MGVSTRDKIKTIIQKALKYLYPNMDTTNLNITFELLLKIREDIYKIDDVKYKSNFPQAYAFDKSMKKYKEKNFNVDYYSISYYSDDGIDYIINSMEKNAKNTSQQFYTGRIPLKKCPRKDVYYYNYVNELDHFFTYWICQYLDSNSSLEKRMPHPSEAGINLVWLDILNNI